MLPATRRTARILVLDRRVPADEQSSDRDAVAQLGLARTVFGQCRVGAGGAVCAAAARRNPRLSAQHFPRRTGAGAVRGGIREVSSPAPAGDVGRDHRIRRFLSHDRVCFGMGDRLARISPPRVFDSADGRSAVLWPGDPDIRDHRRPDQRARDADDCRGLDHRFRVRLPAAVLLPRGAQRLRVLGAGVYLDRPHLWSARQRARKNVPHRSALHRHIAVLQYRGHSGRLSGALDSNLSGFALRRCLCRVLSVGGRPRYLDRFAADESRHLGRSTMTRNLFKLSTQASALLCALSLCAAGHANADAYDAAVANPGRSAADLKRDALDHPAELLRLTGIKPGMRVADVLAGDGYYSELASLIVGPKGKVLMINNAAFDHWSDGPLQARLASDRLANVEHQTLDLNHMQLAPASLDAILLVKVYHDLYWIDSEGVWPKIDTRGVLDQLAHALKPGGVLLLVDHSAKAGSGTAAASSLHRIDEAYAIKDFESHGFKVAAKSDLLRRPDDARDQISYKGAALGKTDRFVLVFHKTAN